MTVKDILIVYDMLGCIWLHHVHKAKSMLKTPCIPEIYHLIYINETSRTPTMVYGLIYLLQNIRMIKAVPAPQPCPRQQTGRRRSFRPQWQNGAVRHRRPV